MHRRIKALLLVMVFTLSTLGGVYLPAGPVQAANQLQIKIHYHRYEGDYDSWNVWSWLSGADGAAYEFSEEDDFGKVAAYTLDIPDGTKEIGFIVRHSTDSNAWDLKDTPDDRFIDITKAKDGVLDVYVIQDEKEFGYGKDEMSLAPKILKASLEDSKTVAFSVTTAFDSTAKSITSKFKLTDVNGKTWQPKSITSEGGSKATSGTLSFSEDLNLLSSYTLSFEGYGESAVSTSKVFSTEEFENAYTYEGDDLGAVWSKEKTSFRVWAPTASSVVLNLYKAGSGSNLIDSYPMKQDVKGTWYLEQTGDLNGVYYTYSVTVDGNTQEAVDPYARTTGINGERGMVIDLDSTDPEGFTEDTRPPFANSTDAVIYELHIRDFSSDDSSGIENKGKYLAFTEKGTTSDTGEKTGIDYLKDLGITHVHLLPSFDYASVNEATLVNQDFNWGYDPLNYNVPEGSYSTDPKQGEVRVNEYKQMVQALHEDGIRVVMDVVYNHTSSTSSSFNKIVPGYYYRMNDDGSYSNASGCGNETASERSMMRKFIIDSVVYWATEYHVDGFRFDLMGIHDTETMNAVRAALNEIDPTILVYGEGWTGGSSTLAEAERAMKANMSSLDTDIAAFSDDIRDGIKGSVFDALDQGFISGKADMEETIKFGVIASTENAQVDYSKVNYSDTFWAKAPTQTITYTSAHDNLTLWDKLCSSNASDSLSDRIKMNLLSCAIVFTSQGTPFFQAGEEFLRSKPADETGTTFDDNSYDSPDSVNSLKWDSVSENKEVYEYYKGMIAFRKAHSALRMTTTEEIQNNLTFLDGLESNVVAYTIDNSPNGESATSLCVIYNSNKAQTTVTIPEGEWNVYIKGNKAGTEILETVSGGQITVEPISAMVLVKEDSKAAASNQDNTASASKNSSKKTALYIALAAVAALLLAGAGFTTFLRRKK